MEELIVKSKEIHGDIFNFSKSVLGKDKKTNIEITCLKCNNTFLKSPHHFLREKSPCKYCNIESFNKMRYEKFIIKSRLIHGNKYDYSKVIMGHDNKVKVEIICKTDGHGSFWQSPYLHADRSNGCPKCSGNERWTLPKFIKESNLIYGDLYDYSKTNIAGLQNNIIVTCKKENHGEFNTNINRHLRGSGCTKCIKENRTPFISTASNEKWTEEEILKLKELYSTKKKTKSEISHILRKSISSVASNIRKYSFSKILSESTRIKVVLRNKSVGRDLTPELLKEIALKYKTRSEFQEKDVSAYQSARRSRILDDICSHMAIVSFSVPQLIMRNIMDGLLMKNSIYSTRKIIPPFEIDVYYPEFKLAFEYNGKGWHETDDAMRRDREKYEKMMHKHITPIYIKERNRNYEEDIKTQLIEQLHTINKVANSNITINKPIIVAI